MRCFKLLLLLLGCLAVGSQANRVVNSSMGLDSAELVTNPCQDVRLAGFVCVDCSTLGFCTNVEGQWQTLSMTECQTERGFFCSDEGTIGCTWQPKCQVPVRGKFYCQLPGIFPDPYDCRSYHDCSEQNVDTPRQCTNGAAYSLLTQSCSMPRDSEQCTEKQYSCSYVGQTGAWAANSSYYYICQKDKQGDQDVFYPLMMRCTDGYTFNGHSCVQTKSKLMRSVEQSSGCQEGIAYPADSSKGYYLCNAGHLVYQRCPMGFYFDAEISSCLDKSKICEEGVRYPAETKYGFNSCLNGELIYQKCPVDYYFDLTQRVCVEESIEICEEFQLYAAETEHGYLFCLNGELTYNSCPDGTIYNGNGAVCTPVHQ